MSENGDDKRPSHSEESHNASEPASPAKTQDPLNVSSSAGDTSPTFRSTSAPASSSITLESPQATRQTENEDTVSQNGRQQSPSATEVGDSKLPLEDFDWDDIEERFCRKMEEFAKTEKELDEEFGEWLQVFKAWSSVTSIHEPDRAHKRLKTRIAYVQIAEKSLEEKREHYIKVVKAFESALALLGGP